MKIMVPVAAIFVAAGSCCCCGGDIEEMIQELQGGSTTFELPEPDAGGDDGAGSGDAGSGSTGSTGGGVTEGLCGRYKDDGLSLPSGFSVIGCTIGNGSESLLAMGSGAPDASCKGVKEWATGKGWGIQYDTAASGAVAVLLQKGSEQMSIACSDSAGQTAIAVSITPK
jgi:hypothetical protein